MKNYSRQLDVYIESTRFANSYCKQNDSRTWVSYFQDENGLIHSSSLNYSIIGNYPVTVEEFKEKIIKDHETSVFLV